MTDAPDGLSFPFADVPGPGETVEVAPGVLWARLPLPIALDHVNVYLLEDDEGWTIIDTGLDTPEIRALWDRLLAGRRLTRIIVTHQHPDHVGLAGWLSERHGATVTMTRTAWLYARMIGLEIAQGPPARIPELYYRAGLSDEQIGWIEASPYGSFARTVPLPPTFHRIREDDRIGIGGEDWRAVIGHGHAPEHLCLFRERDSVLLAADQCLSKITSVVGVYPTEPEDDPLADWLESCARLRATLPVGTLVLPGHGTPFYGLHERLTALIAHHHTALDELEAFLTTPRRAAECFPVLFPRRIGRGVIKFAAMEAMAHLNHLVRRGRARRIEGEPCLWQAVNSR